MWQGRRVSGVAAAARAPAPLLPAMLAGLPAGHAAARMRAHLLQHLRRGQAVVHGVAVADQGHVRPAAPQAHLANLRAGQEVQGWRARRQAARGSAGCPAAPAPFGTASGAPPGTPATQRCSAGKPARRRMRAPLCLHHRLRARTGIGVPLRSGVMPSAARSRPVPLPRGKRKQEGRSSMAAHVATMLMSSASLEGAMTTMLGRQAMKATSKAPQCVAPSAPTMPARSMAKRTAGCRGAGAEAQVSTRLAACRATRAAAILAAEAAG